MSIEKRRIPVECYSRVVGYFRPVDQWAQGKQEEFNQRKTYDANGRTSDYTN